MSENEASLIKVMQNGFDALSAQMSSLEKRTRSEFRIINSKIERVESEVRDSKRTAEAGIKLARAETRTGFARQEARREKLRAILNKRGSLLAKERADIIRKIAALQADMRCVKSAVVITKRSKGRSKPKKRARA